MKSNRYFVAISTLVLTTGVLLLIGYIFTIPLLMFRYENTDEANGVFVSTGSIFPFIFGLGVSFLLDKIYVYKYHRKLG
ncbi:hypothetical protein [Peribacillus glennii]|uniref:Uncharacterized protein n=1 Tax=Peribacillus glennii TaxID=2303991 RepID=A0A372LBE0_9BACI|nr:hypothetical protein [Peribacillus glennii]RFU62887.1 hypothetical protein D0466_13120 [Peribacillus glennii]